MAAPHRSPAFGSLALIAVVIGAGAAAFAYTAGWFSPQRLTPDKLVDAFTPPDGRAARPSPEPCQGHLLHRHLRSEWGRVGAFAGSGFRPRPVSGPRALQSRHRRSERAGCDGPGAGPGTADLDAGRAGMAQRHDRSPVLSGVDAASLLRAAARLGEQGPERDEDIRRARIPSSRRSAPGPRARPGPAATRKSGSTASTASSSPTVPARSMSVRWSLLPAAQPVPVSPDDLAKRGPDFLEQEITERVAGAPQRWTMVVTVANPGDPDRGPEQGLAGRSPHRRGRHAHRAADRSRAGRPMPRHQLRSDRPAVRHTDIGRSVSRPRGRLPTRSRTTFARRRPRTIPEPQREPSHDRGRQRFTPLQRLLHWLMAVCILAMLFIGVGMVSTVMPKYLTLVSIHKPLGIAILVLALIRLAVRLRYGAPPLPADLPEPMKLAADLSHYAFYALMIGMPLIGWGMLSAAAYPVVLIRRVASSSDPAAERQPACAALECALLPCLRVLCADPVACRGGAVPCARPARRRVRGDGVRINLKPGRQPI